MQKREGGTGMGGGLLKDPAGSGNGGLRDPGGTGGGGTIKCKDPGGTDPVG